MSIQEFDPLGRIRTFQKKIEDASIHAVILQYSKSLYYYAGTTQPSYLMITPDDYHLLVLKGYEHIPGESWLPEGKISRAKRTFGDAAALLKKWGVERGKLGMELDVIPAALFLKAAGTLPDFRITDVSHIILEQRKIKDKEELRNLRESCRIVHAGHERIVRVLREGMTEIDLSVEIEDAHRRAGHEGQYFNRQFDFFMGRGPVASGENLSKIAGKVQSITGMGLSSAIPLGASRRVLEKGDIVVVDIPTIYHGYHSDQSRTYAVGKAPAACRELYQGMKEIADRTIEYIRPGLTCHDVYERTFSIARKIGMETYYLKLGGHSGPLPFVGHGVGLEVNEFPMLSKGSTEVIQAGMVMTLEIEMWKSEKEVVKLEDTLAVHPEGVEILTITPRELCEL